MTERDKEIIESLSMEIRNTFNHYGWNGTSDDVKSLLERVCRYRIETTTDTLSDKEIFMKSLRAYLEVVEGLHTASVPRQYKDSCFYTIYNEPKAAALLASQLLGHTYTESEIKVVTLNDTGVNSRHNDLGIQAGNDFVILCEAQATACPNMPMRMLLYYAYTVENYIKINNKSKDFYGSRQLIFPTPRFYVVDTTHKMPSAYSLSAAFLNRADIDFKVSVIDKVDNSDLCNPLYLYFDFVHFIESNKNSLTTNELLSRWHKRLNNYTGSDIMKHIMLEKEDKILGYLFEELTTEDRIEVETRIAKEETIAKMVNSFFKSNMPRDAATKLLEDAFPEHLDIVDNALNKYYK